MYEIPTQIKKTARSTLPLSAIDRAKASTIKNRTNIAAMTTLLGPNAAARFRINATGTAPAQDAARLTATPASMLATVPAPPSRTVGK